MIMNGWWIDRGCIDDTNGARGCDFCARPTPARPVAYIRLKAARAFIRAGAAFVELGRSTAPRVPAWMAFGKGQPAVGIDLQKWM